MHTVAQTSDRIALQNRFATYEVSWNGVKNPTGTSRIGKIANAAIEVIKNLAKHVYNTVVWPLNKAYNLFHKQTEVKAQEKQESADPKPSVVYEQEHVTVYAEPATLAQPDVLIPMEELPELQVVAAKKLSLTKIAALGFATFASGAALMIAMNRFLPNYSPSFFGQVDKAICFWKPTTGNGGPI